MDFECAIQDIEFTVPTLLTAIIHLRAVVQEGKMNIQAYLNFVKNIPKKALLHP